MDCKRARQKIYISEYPELVEQELIEAKRHAKECRECAEFLEAEAAFGSLLRNTLDKEPVPDSLKTLLYPPKKRRLNISNAYKLPAIAAAVLLIATVIIYFSGANTGSSDILDKILNDHVKFLPARQAHVDSPDPDEITAWFRGRVNFPVLPPVISAKLLGGRLCVLRKKHFALLFYEYGKSPVSVFITDGNIPINLKTKKEVMLKDKRAYVMDKRGYTILFWEDKGLMYSLVSEMDTGQIVKFF